MITCKEVLCGTVIEIKSRDEARFVEEFCAKLGIEVGYWPGCKFDDDSVCAKISHDNGAYGSYLVFSGTVEDISVDAPEFKDLKKLTLSDLKPRTKVEYEKVTDSIFDLKDEFESLNLYDSNKSVISDVDYLAELFLGGGIYRKVERPVEWWEDALEYVVSLSDDDIMNEYDPLSESISIKVSMNRNQAQDFARIILEQEGE